MGPDQFAANGFILALDIMSSLGFKFNADSQQFDANQIMDQLSEVARGETSLYNSPAEELAEAEENRGGRPATLEELAYFQSAFADRQGHDKRNRSTAIQVLRVMGDTTPPPPPRGPMPV